jgi:hypothetical protein
MNRLFQMELIEDFWQSPNRNKWLRGIIISGVFLITILLSIIASQSLWLLTLSAVGGLIGLVLLLRWPSLGLVVILLSSFFVSFTGPGGVNASVILIILMAVVFTLDMLVVRKKIIFTHKRLSLSILFFGVSAIFSFLVGQLPWYSFVNRAPIDAQAGGLAIFILSGFAIVIAANVIHHIRLVQVFTWIFVFICALYLSGRLIPALGNVLRLFFQVGAVRSSVFWVWMFVIPFSQAIINTKLSLPVRAALMVFFGAASYVAIVMANDWKSGFLPPLAGIAIIVILLLRKHAIWFIPIGVAIAIYSGRVAIATENYSWFTRIEAWRIVIKLMSVNPLFGLGFGNYYFFTPLIPINGWQVNFNSHNQYIDILAQTGIIGLVTFGWICWEIFKIGWRLRGRAPEGFARAYVYGALGGLVGMLVSGGLVDWILPFVYNIGMSGFRSSVIGWIFLGGLVAIDKITEQNENIVLDGGNHD